MKKFILLLTLLVPLNIISMQNTTETNQDICWNPINVMQVAAVPVFVVGLCLTNLYLKTKNIKKREAELVSQNIELQKANQFYKQGYQNLARQNQELKKFNCNLSTILQANQSTVTALSQSNLELSQERDFHNHMMHISVPISPDHMSTTNIIISPLTTQPTTPQENFIN